MYLYCAFVGLINFVKADCSLNGLTYLHYN